MTNMSDATNVAQVAKRKKVTIPQLMAKKQRGEPIVQLAVYDYENAIVGTASVSISSASAILAEWSCSATRTRLPFRSRK